MTRQRAPEPVNTGVGGSGTAQEARVLRPRPQATTPPPTAAPLAARSPGPPSPEVLRAALPYHEADAWKGLLPGTWPMQFNALKLRKAERRGPGRPPVGAVPHPRPGRCEVETDLELRWRLMRMLERARGAEAPLEEGKKSSFREAAVWKAATARPAVLELGACLWAPCDQLQSQGDPYLGLFKYSYKAGARRTWRLTLEFRLHPGGGRYSILVSTLLAYLRHGARTGPWRQKVAMHVCECPSCINPRHIGWGDKALDIAGWVNKRKGWEGAEKRRAIARRVGCVTFKQEDLKSDGEEDVVPRVVRGGRGRRRWRRTPATPGAS